jgi:hypothetical protein
VICVSRNSTGPTSQDFGVSCSFPVKQFRFSCNSAIKQFYDRCRFAMKESCDRHALESTQLTPDAPEPTRYRFPIT